MEIQTLSNVRMAVGSMLSRGSEMQSQSFKIVVLMFAAAYVVTWVAISIRTNAMYVPPAELNSGLIVSVLLQVINGVVGKAADKRIGQ
jgi:hypothetical protein